VKEWHKTIYLTQFALNQKINCLYNTNLFFILHGRSGWNKNQLFNFGLDVGKDGILSEEDNTKLIKLHLDNWKFITNFVYNDIAIKMKEKKESENIKTNMKRKIKQYNIGEIVMMKVNTNNKLEIRWVGPFKITCKTTSGFFNLACNNGKIAYQNIPTNFLSKSKFKIQDVLS
jgi:hypothetical protein